MNDADSLVSIIFNNLIHGDGCRNIGHAWNAVKDLINETR